MGTIQSHRDLKVWQFGMSMVEQVYSLAKRLPDTERFGLISQMTRAAVAVPANIAEGHARGTRRDYAHFVSIARGSLMETETYVLLTVRLGFVEREVIMDLVNLIRRMSKMLTALRNRLVADPAT